MVETGLVPRLRFPEFRGSGGWEATTVGAVCKVLPGYGFPEELQGRTSGRYPFCKVSDVSKAVAEAGGALESAANYVDERDVFDLRAKLLPIGTTVFAKIGEALRLNRRAITNRECLIDNNVVGLKASADRGDDYFIYLTSQKIDLTEYCGGAVPSVNKSTFEAISLPLPGLREQRRIAACLSSLDDLIAAEVKTLDTLKVYKKGLMQQLFPQEGETVPRLRFPEFRGAGEWEHKRLEDLAVRGSGHTPNKSHPEYYNGGIGWVSLADTKRLDRGIITETEIAISAEGIKNSSAVLHSEGSVLLSRDAGVGKSAVMGRSMAVSQHFIVWTCKPGQLSNWFLFYTLQLMKPLFETIATGSTIKTIGLPFFVGLRIPTPTVPEQSRIATFLSSLDQRLAAQVQRVNALKTHKKGLMQGLFPTTPEEE